MHARGMQTKRENHERNFKNLLIAYFIETICVRKSGDHTKSIMQNHRGMFRGLNEVCVTISLIQRMLRSNSTFCDHFWLRIEYQKSVKKSRCVLLRLCDCAMHTI